MNKMKILVTYAGVWKMDNGSSGMTLNYFMYGWMLQADLSDSRGRNVPLTHP